MHLRPAASAFHRGVLTILLGALVWVGTLPLTPPDVAPSSARASDFSAERALVHLEVLASSSRAVGTPGHAAARQYLARVIQGMGMEPEIQVAPSHVRFEGASGFSAGTVHNVLARLAGTDNTGAIVVNAHYDSGTTGPGASDCGSCVVTALETMRALRAGDPLRNDVIFVFSDAEEEGDLGAAAFVKEHPWAGDARIAINYEAQGSGGPAFLYATSPQNGWLVSEFFEVAPNVTAYSWMRAIMDVHPAGQLDCDLAEYTKAGIQGLGFVYTAESQDYHTVRDNVARIDPGSVQQEGSYTLALLRHLGNADLTAPPRAVDRVFFNVLPGVVVHYPEASVWWLNTVVTAVVLMLILMGVRRRRVALRSVSMVTVLAGLGTFIVIGLVTALWAAVRRLDPALQVNLVGTYHDGLYLGGLLAGIVALMATGTLWLRRFGPESVAMGSVLAFGSFLWLVSLTMPAMSYIATWPMLFAAVPLAWIVWGPERGRHDSWRRVAVLTIGASAALVLLPSTLHQAVALLHRFEGAAGLPVLGLVSLFAAPAALLLVQQIDFVAGSGESRWLVPGGAASIAVILLVGAATVSGFDEDRPRPDHMSYVLDADGAAARWVSFDRHLDHWTGEFVGAGSARAPYETVAWGTFEAFTSPAPAIELEAPAVEVAGDGMTGGVRTLRLRVSSPRGASHLRARVEAGGPILSATLDQRPLDLTGYPWVEEGMLTFNYAGVPDDGFTLILEIEGVDPVRLLLEDSTLGHPPALDDLFPPRPPDTMPNPLYRQDATEVRKVFVL